MLVVGGDDTVADRVAGYLRQNDFSVEVVASGSAALRAAADRPPDLVLLDLRLPDMNGLAVCARLRDRQPPLPVIMVSALAGEAERVLGLEAGADDYLAHPVNLRELVLRIRSVLRRRVAEPPARADLLVDGDLTVDTGAQEVALAGRRLRLTVREYHLLVFLLRHPGQVHARAELLERVWGWSHGHSATVTVHVRRLREKIEPQPTAPQRVVTVRGVGYRYDRRCSPPARHDQHRPGD